LRKERAIIENLRALVRVLNLNNSVLFPSNEELNSSYTSTSVKKLNVTVFSIGGTKKYYSSSSKPFLDEITEQTNERGTYSQNIDPNMLSAPI